MRVDWLSNRAAEAEYMDDFTIGGEELGEALRHLRLLNRIFCASGPALYGVKRLWAEAGKPGKLSVLDIGSGSGDVNRALLRWAERNRVELRIELIDATEEACAEARRIFAREPRVTVTLGDLFDLPERRADIATASQFVHHFADERLPEALRMLLRASRLGAVVSDIHRHPVAWSAVWVATRLLSRNRYIRHDGPLSVAKGFRAADWRRLQRELPDVRLQARWRPLFRYAVMVAKNADKLAEVGKAARSDEDETSL